MIGIDFGTTNSTVAAVSPKGEVRFATYAGNDPLFRSALYFPDPELLESSDSYVHIGREAVERYEAAPDSGRLIKSLKTFLTAPALSTRIHGKEWTLEALIALLVRSLVRFSEQSLGKFEGPVVVGRPVHFVHENSAADEARALTRIREAFAKAGVAEVHFEYEPIAAAYTYERTLDHDEVVLVGDFGGGTSDFSVVQVGPGARHLSASERVLAREGVGIAGDVIDGRIIYQAASPLLGQGRLCRNALTGAITEVPRWFYFLLSDPARHFMLKEQKSLQLLGTCLSDAQNDATRQELTRLKTIIMEGLSYQLFHCASQSKANLSTSSQAPFKFTWEEVALQAAVARKMFEQWIARDVTLMLDLVDEMLAKSSLPRARIDRVFLTGGTAQIPLIREAFARHFGVEKIAHQEGFFTSVAEGLALRSQQL